MKRFLPILLSLTLILALCACGDKEEKTTVESATETHEKVSTDEGEENNSTEENKGPVIKPPTGGDSEEIGSIPIFPGQSSTTTSTTKKSDIPSQSSKKESSTSTTTKRPIIELPPVPLG